MEATVYPNHSAAIAYLIFPPLWRQGYAKEGCVDAKRLVVRHRLLAHLLQAYEVNIVAAEIDTRNVASIGLIEALGFERVSTKTNADFFKGAVSHEPRYKRVSSSTSLLNMPFTSI